MGNMQVNGKPVAELYYEQPDYWLFPESWWKAVLPDEPDPMFLVAMREALEKTLDETLIDTNNGESKAYTPHIYVGEDRV